MKNLHLLDAYRISSAEMIEKFGSVGNGLCGAFTIPSATNGATLRVIAAVGKKWDHVSVSCADRCPTWAEMEQVKRMFFRDGETAMQLHVTPKDHINVHPFCLHLWRPHNTEIPLPPKWMVG